MAEHGLGHIGRVRDWECVTQDGCAEKRALRLAQGGLPDIFFRAALTNEEVASLASAGQLVDLAPMLEQYAPNFSALMERDPTIRLSTMSLRAPLISSRASAISRPNGMNMSTP